jgi:beta-lactamase superfamily II metal-dependent hydrolase
VLLTGDLEAGGEAVILARRQLGATYDVLKIGHHGSATSSSPPFLAAVGAPTALISAGAGNRFGHPHAGVLARLRAVSTVVWRTDEAGAVGVEIDARGWSVRGTVSD